jgi:hypothetical protein
MGPAALAAIPALFQTGVGVWQALQANKLAKDRPVYQRPEEINQMVQVAKNLAAQRTMPGYNTYADRIGSDAAAAYGRIAEGTAGTGAGLGAAAQMNVGANRALQDLGVANANYYTQNQGTLMNALSSAAPYADREFEWNAAQPYMEAARASAAMREGSLQNMMGGLSSGVSGVNSAMLNERLLEMWGEGKKTSPGTSTFDNGMMTGPPTFDQWAQGQPQTSPFQAALQKIFQFSQSMKQPPYQMDWTGAGGIPSQSTYLPL